MRINRVAAESTIPYTAVVEGMGGEYLAPLYIHSRQQTEMSEMILKEPL